MSFRRIPVFLSILLAATVGGCVRAGYVFGDADGATGGPTQDSQPTDAYSAGSDAQRRDTVSTDDGLAIDGLLPRKWCEVWRNPTAFSAPTPLAAVNTVETESDPVWAGGKLYFTRKSESTGVADLFVASATSLSAVGSASSLVALNSSADEGRIAFYPASKVYAGGAVLASRRSGSWQLYAVSGLPLRIVGGPILSTAASGPSFSQGGTVLWFADVSGGDPGQALFFSTRTTPTATFGPRQLPNELSTPSREFNPWISADERVILFSSDRPGGQGDLDIWIATRGSANAPFDPPQPIGAVNSASTDDAPSLSEDNCTLLYSSQRNASAAGGEIFYATFLPGPS
ncbi:MAG: PD40 domain-containing protein [Deltaproteobacteria bacterium]|nr:PD40 domain-containing protein [Deltaproteobacteria bacterium]